jgi:very-short-patch-repair endonuclease
MTNASRANELTPLPAGEGGARDAQRRGRVRAAMRHYRDLPSGAVAHARGLRRSQTEPEKRLWRALREKLPSAKFRRQVPFGPYVVDFLSFSGRMIVEVDGGQHAEAAEYDAARTRYLADQGYRVLRFWNNDVIENLDGVLDRLAATLPPSPSHAAAWAPPSPVGRGAHGDY